MWKSRNQEPSPAVLLVFLISTFLSITVFPCASSCRIIMQTPLASFPAPPRRDFLARTALTAAAALAPSALLGATAPTVPARSNDGAYDIGILEKWFFDG